MGTWKTLDLVVSLDEPDEAHAESLRVLCDSLSSDPWAAEPPRFMDEIEGDGTTNEGDAPIRTVGLVLSVLAPISGNERLSPSEDQRQYRQVERFLTTMSGYSIRTGVRLRVHYNGEEIGEIAGRDLSRGIVDGLLAPWRKEVGLYP